MELLLDIGNSTLRWGWLDDDNAFGFGGALDWPARPEQVLATIESPSDEIAGVWVANVGPRAALHSLLSSLKARYGGYRMVFSEPRCCGVINGYADFSLLGVDRWLALIGARRKVRAPHVLVVDAGTAITADLLSKKQHQGGFIVPGPGLMRRCLAHNTGALAAALAASPNHAPDGGLGRTTREAIEGGVHYMSAAFVQSLHVDLTAQLGKAPHLVLTGGQAESLAGLLALEPMRIEPHLVLEGLAEVVRHERKDG